MLALISFFIVILFSMIIVKIGAIALESTGLSKDICAFQSQSAFSGVGFTTKESEMMMAHPFRRKILRILMLMGSAGLTSAIATLIITFMNSSSEFSFFGFNVNSVLFNLMAISVGLVIIFIVTNTEWFDKYMRHVFEKPMKKLNKKVALYDYETILGLSKGYVISSFIIPKNHWMVNKSIHELEMEKEGVVIIGIYRTVHKHEEFLGIPTQDFKIQTKDRIMVYCHENILENLAKREKGHKGAQDRKEAILEQKKSVIIKKIDEHKLSEIEKHNKKYAKKKDVEEVCVCKKIIKKDNNSKNNNNNNHKINLVKKELKNKLNYSNKPSKYKSKSSSK